MSGGQDVAITIPVAEEIELTNTIRSGPASSQGGDHVTLQTPTEITSDMEVIVEGEDAPLLAGNPEVMGAENKRQDREAAIQLAGEISKRLEIFQDPSISQEIPPSIFRIHPQIRNEDPNSYEPQLISIGPFHHGKPALEPMESLKWKYLHDLLSRYREITLADCVSAVLAVENDARRYYWGDVGLDRTKFVDVLVVDGCFILEFLIKRALGPVGPPFNYAKWYMTLLRNDLLLLENQIPFLVLRALFDLVTAHTGGTVNINGNICNLMGLALPYINKDRVNSLAAETQVFHLLHLFQLCILANSGTRQPLTPPRLPTNIMRGVSSKLVTSFYFVVSFMLFCTKSRRAAAMTDHYPRTIPSASELRDAGIGFVKNAAPDGRYRLDVSFKDGNIEMHTLTVDQKVKSQFRNLIALEECSRQVENRVTPFAALMSNLVDTAEDVAILEEHGVLVSKLGSNEEAASFFNKLGSGCHMNFDNHYLKDLFKQVREYCELDQHRWRAQLVHEYFSNPWTAISFFAALVLLVMTIAQAAFAVLSYVKPPSSSK